MVKLTRPSMEGRAGRQASRKVKKIIAKVRKARAKPKYKK